MRNRWMYGAVVLLSILATMAGCGGGDDGGSAPVGKTVSAKVLEQHQDGVNAQVGQWVVDIPVASGDDPAFTVGKVISPPGNANFGLRNSTGERHNLTIEEVGGEVVETPTIRDGHAWVRKSLFVGKRYVFYCSLHRAEGMEGTIEVDPKLIAENLKPY